ncbi:MAG: HPP family protein [Acidimicrobiales bacterium]
MTAASGSTRQPRGLLHVYVAQRYLLLTGILVGVVGVAGHWLAWPLITSTVGPTAYVFAAHPESETSRFRHAVIGHTVAVAAGLGALAAFGLLHHTSVSTTAAPTWAQAAAVAAAAGVTVAVLEMAGSHHAPAAATALLIATGLAKPGAPLIGLVVGLAVVITAGPIVGRAPFGRTASTADQTGGRNASRSIATMRS